MRHVYLLLFTLLLALPAAAQVGPAFGPVRVSHTGTDGDVWTDAAHAAVGYVASADVLLVVWQGDDADGAPAVWAQRLEAATGTPVDAAFAVSPDAPAAGSTAQRPALACRADDCLVVWQGVDGQPGEVEVFARRVAADGTLPDAAFRLSQMGPDGDAAFAGFDPAVAYSPSADAWLVVWSGDTDAAGLVDGELEIWGHRVGSTGAPAGSAFRISDMGPDGDPAFRAGQPAVAWGEADWLVVWSGDDDAAPLVDDELEIFGQRITTAGGDTGANDVRISAMGDDGDVSARAVRPTVAYGSRDGSFLVAWSGTDGRAPYVADEYEVFARRLDADGTLLGDGFRLSDMGGDGSAAYPALAPAAVYDDASDEFLVVWHGEDDAAPLVDAEREVFSQRVSATRAGGETGANDARVSWMGTTDGDAAYGAGHPAVTYNPAAPGTVVVWHGDDDRDGQVDGEHEIFAAGYRQETPLPVTLTAFEARVDGDAVALAWQTASERANVGFEVQHRTAGEPDWSVVAFVQGAGTTTRAQAYGHRVEGLPVGTHRFRLAQRDADGATTYSAEVETVVRLRGAYALSAPYPNPMAGRSRFTLAVSRRQPVEVAVFDLLGRRVAVLHDGPVAADETVRLALDAADLPAGLYIVRAAGETFTAVQRVVVAR